MELSRQQEAQMRRIGREALQKAVSAANAGNDGMKRMIGRVTKVNSDYSVDVDFGSNSYPMPITGVRYTTACHGVQVGDRAIVDVVDHLAICSGILANSDNGPYVNLDKRYMRLGGAPSKLFSGTIVRTVQPNSDSVDVWSNAQFIATFGSKCDIGAGACVAFMNGDGYACGLHVEGATMLGDVVYATFRDKVSVATAVRLNFIVALPC